MTSHQFSLPKWRYCTKCRKTVRSCPHDNERHTVKKEGKWWWVLQDNSKLICEVYIKKDALAIKEFLNSV